MTAAQDRSNPFTIALWVLAAAVLVAGFVVLIAGFSAATATEAFEEYDASKGTLQFEVGVVLIAAGAVLAGMPLAVKAFARELGAR